MLGSNFVYVMVSIKFETISNFSLTNKQHRRILSFDKSLIYICEKNNIYYDNLLDFNWHIVRHISVERFLHQQADSRGFWGWGFRGKLGRVRFRIYFLDKLKWWHKRVTHDGRRCVRMRNGRRMDTHRSPTGNGAIYFRHQMKGRNESVSDGGRPGRGCYSSAIQLRARTSVHDDQPIKYEITRYDVFKWTLRNIIYNKDNGYNRKIENIIDFL